MIEICNLTKIYNSSRNTVLALDDISFKLPSRGLVAIYGENGCGKTTLLNAIATVDTDYTGNILFDGTDIRKIEKDYRRNIVSFVFQENDFVSYLDISENIELFSEDTEKIQEYCKEFGIDDKLFSISSELSGGQKQRAAVIRGLLKNYAILLVDEPTSSMNSQMETGIFEKLCDLSKEKLVVLVSHNLDLIHKYADVIIHMDKGKIISLEENASSEIRYEENTVFIPENFSNFAKLNQNILNEMLASNGKIQIQTFVPANNKTMDFDNTPLQIEHKAAKKLSKDLKKSIFAYSRFNLKSEVLLTEVFTVLCLVALTLSICFYSYNHTGTTYSCFKNNIQGYVMYEEDNTTYGYWNEKEKISFKNYQELIKKYNSDVVFIINYDNYRSLEYIPKGIYSNEMDGIVLYDEENISLALGRFPEEDEMLVTDYMAQSIVQSVEEYSSLEDVVNYGIEYLGRIIKVSGIVDTDYEKYINQYQDIENRKQFERDCKSSYCCFYYPMKTYLEAENIYYFFDFLNKEMPEIRSIENYKVAIDRSEEYEDRINDSIKESMIVAYSNNYVYSTKGKYALFSDTSAGYMLVLGEVDTNEDYPVYYLSKSDLSEFKENLLNESIRLLIKPKSIKEIEYLDGFKLMHNTRLSDMLSKVEEAVFAVKYLMKYLCIIMAVLVTFILLISVSKQVRSNYKLIAFMKMAGYSKGEYFWNEIMQMLLTGGISVFISVVILFISIIFINKSIGISVNADINLFMGNNSLIILGYAGFIILYATIGIINLIKTDKKTIIQLLK